MIAQGDKCWVQSVLTTRHYGICTGLWPDGRYWFIHNTPDGGVLHTPVEGFARGRPIHIEQSAQPGQEAVVAQRALDLLGRKYDLLAFNCEHAANLAATGRAESPQVRNAFLFALFAAGAAYVNQNGTYVDDDGRRRNGRGQFASRLWW